MISIKDVCKSFGKKTVLRDISLDVEEGQFVCILGPSGTGKSTFLKIIAGLLRQTKGTVHVNSNNLSEVSPHKRNFGYVFQDPDSLFPYLSVKGNVGFPIKVGDRKAINIDHDLAVREVIERVGIGHLTTRPIHTLSGGEKQRVALARSLVFESDALLLDEPLSALDNITKNDIRNQIKNLAKEYLKPILYVTHDEREAQLLSDKIAIISDGDLLQFDKTKTVFSKPNSHMVSKIIGGWASFNLNICELNKYLHIPGNKTLTLKKIGWSNKSNIENRIIAFQEEVYNIQKKAFKAFSLKGKIIDKKPWYSRYRLTIELFDNQKIDVIIQSTNLRINTQVFIELDPNTTISWELQ